MLIGSQPSQPDLTTRLTNIREIFNGDPLLYESQDQGDSIHVTRLEKWVLLLARRFLFPDKLKLKKDNGSVTSPGVMLSPLMR